MATFTYRAKNQAGKTVRGTLQAINRERARLLLSANKLTPLEIQGENKNSLLQKTIISGRVNTRDLILFSRQLSAMIRSGVPILGALRALEKQVDKENFSKLIGGIAYDIEGGESLSNALAKHEKTFSVFYQGVVRTGEASGRLSESLEVLAEYLERNYTFMRKLRSALMYPIFVLIGVAAVITIMFTFVVPQLVTLFEEADVALPLPTRILVATTNIIGTYWYIAILLGLVLLIVGRSYLRTAEGQYTASTWALRIPLVNRLYRKVYLARLTSILNTLFASDVPVIQALNIASSSLGNRVYQRILKETAEAVKNGASMSSVWEREPYIPAMLVTMVGVGERSGEIETAFSEANRFFRRDVDEILESVTVFLEPILIVVLGIGVALVVAAVLLPIYNLVLVL